MGIKPRSRAVAVSKFCVRNARQRALGMYSVILKVSHKLDSWMEPRGRRRARTADRGSN